MMAALRFNTASAEDQAAIAALLAAAPEAAAWNWEPGSPYAWLLATDEATGQLAGLLVVQTLVADEHEILNLAVAPEFRRKGVAQALLQQGLAELRGRIFLEVRESNVAARGLYEKSGFVPISVRAKYYANPTEAAIVLALQKW